jgi:hypothetical protein
LSGLESTSDDGKQGTGEQEALENRKHLGAQKRQKRGRGSFRRL